MSAIRNPNLPIIAVTFLCLLSISFSVYSDPPISDVLNHNNAAASNLQGFYDNSSPISASFTIPFKNNPKQMSANASLDILGMNLMEDGAACPADGLTLLLASGISVEPLTAIPSGGYPDFICDAQWFQYMNDETSWRCDFDNDYCAEYVNQIGSYDDFNVTFIMGNFSESVESSSVAVTVPDATLEAMRESSGLDNLTVLVQGNITIAYQINDRTFGYGDCASNLTTILTSVPVDATSSFPVHGTDKIFFVRSPLLDEQWYKDSRFDVALLSQCPIYSAWITLDGNRSVNFTLRNFDMSENNFGLEQIDSEPINDSSNISVDPFAPVSSMGGKIGWNESILDSSVSPYPLEEKNGSFAYSYTFDFGYSKGPGTHNLMISVVDNCGNIGNRSETILDRMISAGNTTMENGLPINSSIARPSAAFKEDSLISSAEVALGLVSFILLLAFANFWLLK